MADQPNAAQPLIDLMNKYHDTAHRVLDMLPSFGAKVVPDQGVKAQPMNWKPTPNAEQQKEIDDRNKTPETKPLSQRTLGGAKRPPIKKPVATQTQRKQP